MRHGKGRTIELGAGINGASPPTCPARHAVQQGILIGIGGNDGIGTGYLIHEVAQVADVPAEIPENIAIHVELVVIQPAWRIASNVLGLCGNAFNGSIDYGS